MKTIGSALMAGLLFALALPPYSWEWLGWFALVPLLVAAQGRRPLEAVGRGLLAGFAGGILHPRWHPNRWGDWLAWLCVLGAATGMIGLLRKADEALRAREAAAAATSDLPA